MTSHAAKWADDATEHLKRVKDAADKIKVAAVKPTPVSAETAKIIRALIQAIDARDPEVIRLVRKISDLNIVYSKRAA